MAENHESHEKDVDQVTGVETTGHEWDGIKELNNPLPRWWLYIFFASIAFSFVYWIFMPAWPGLHLNTPGIRNHSERKNVEQAVAALEDFRSENAQRLLGANSLEDIVNDPELLQFAMAAGQSAFGDNCATCHGVGGTGNKGFPNLNDDVWIWGGKLADIKQTITHGIRNDDPESRFSMMPAFGEQGLLSDSQINELVDYVRSLSGLEHNAAAAEAGAKTFEMQCAACHGPDGKGDRSLGALNLTDQDWLFGNSRADIKHTIWYAQNASMPNWGARLNETTITSLAVYVHSLGGGE